jgi:hypothetical protein
MKLVTCLLLSIVMIGCSSSNNQETSSSDSTALNDTLDVHAFADEESDEIAEEEDTASDTSQLEITFDETAGMVFERQEPYYTVTIVTDQYEASSDVTWYFDDEFSPIYFKESWSAEGNEGSTEYFAPAGSVECAYSEEYNTVDKWCKSTGGTRSTINDESGEANVELLPSDYRITVEGELSRYLDILKAILSEAEVTDEDENSYTLAITETTEIGGNEVKESTTVHIPKKVYEALK